MLTIRRRVPHRLLRSLTSSSPTQKFGDSKLELCIVFFGTIDLKTSSSAHFVATHQYTPLLISLFSTPAHHRP
ncbi:hypothetical protein U1Q18_029322, partial [Sarracenia purpurea var. burkii]